MPKSKKNAGTKTSVSYDDLLIAQLKDHTVAIAYLNNALEESKKGDDESLELFLMALRNVAQAHGGLTKIARKTGLGRESLYKTLSSNGNPEFRTLNSVIDAMGLSLRFFRTFRFMLFRHDLCFRNGVH